MGLDMYLSARRSIANYEWYDESERKLFSDTIRRIRAEDLVSDESPQLEIHVTCAYWRKANQIHNWFVENVQDGKDDCGDYYVSRSQLEELRELCQRVLASTRLVPGEIYAGTTYSNENPEGDIKIEEGQVLGSPQLAAELLPPRSGFFFRRGTGSSRSRRRATRVSTEPLPAGVVVELELLVGREALVDLAHGRFQVAPVPLVVVRRARPARAGASPASPSCRVGVCAASNRGLRQARRLSCARRLAASWQYDSFNSIRMVRRPCLRATRPVVPDPANGSSTVPPSGHPARMQRRASSSGKTAKWACA